VEGYSQETDLLLQGRLSSQAPEVDGAVYLTAGTGEVGRLHRVKITHTHTYDLVGEILDSQII
jgi:ribosomal protein S12 methylthiotransferase